MTEETHDQAWFTPPAAGQPSNASQGTGDKTPAPAEQAQQNPTPPVSTPPQVDVQAIIDQALDARDRKLQAASDKRQNALRTEIERLSQLVQKLNQGAAPTPEQSQVIRQQAEATINQQSPGPASPGAPGQAPAGSGEPNESKTPPNWKIELINAALAKESIELDASDPEAATLRDLVASSTDPDELLQAAKQVAGAKRARLGQSARVTTPTAGGGSIPGNNIANINDPDILFRMAREKLVRR